MHAVTPREVLLHLSLRWLSAHWRGRLSLWRLLPAHGWQTLPWSRWPLAWAGVPTHWWSWASKLVPCLTRRRRRGASGRRSVHGWSPKRILLLPITISTFSSSHRRFAGSNRRRSPCRGGRSRLVAIVTISIGRSLAVGWGISVVHWLLLVPTALRRLLVHITHVERRLPVQYQV